MLDGMKYQTTEKFYKRLKRDQELPNLNFLKRCIAFVRLAQNQVTDIDFNSSKIVFHTTLHL